MAFTNLSGTNAVTYYSPTIFTNVGLSGGSVRLLATSEYGLVKLVACVIFITFVTDTLCRRRSLSALDRTRQVTAPNAKPLKKSLSLVLKLTNHEIEAGTLLRWVLHSL
ncbi:hypothetical protein F5Y03DRAFT_378792 [Xylaria venustula]|nr:hypothetical protein F5Y03DRAFT_378792 [Xylaria venustula]